MKYNYSIRGNETKHHLPHVHIRFSDSRKIVLSLPDLNILLGGNLISSKELKQIKKDLESKKTLLFKEFYIKNPDKKQ